MKAHPDSERANIPMILLHSVSCCEFWCIFNDLQQLDTALNHEQFFRTLTLVNGQCPEFVWEAVSLLMFIL